MTYYALLFVAGLAGSFHCIGMCGGFACALGGNARGWSAATLRQMIYNFGRLTSYCFMGALAGTLGQGICTSYRPAGVVLLDTSLDAAQRGLALVAGLLMIGMALTFFGVRGLHRVAAGFGGATLAAAIRRLLATPGPGATLALGVFNGFLPCPLVYALVAQAASGGGALPGVLTMASFGLGTFPAMLAMSVIGRRLRPAWRRRGVWLAGGFIMALGLLTVSRGIVPMVWHIGHRA